MANERTPCSPRKMVLFCPNTGVEIPHVTVFLPLLEKAVKMGFEPPETLEGWSRFDWNGAPRPWLSRREALLVEKATYITSGIDTQLVENSGLRRNPILWRLHRFYARICRKRCEHSEFGPMPELPLLKLLKHWLSVV